MHEGEAVAPRPPYRRTCLHNTAFPLSMNGKPQPHPGTLRNRTAKGPDSSTAFLKTRGRPPLRTLSPTETLSPPLCWNAEESTRLLQTGQREGGCGAGCFGGAQRP